MEEENCRE